MVRDDELVLPRVKNKMANTTEKSTEAVQRGIAFLVRPEKDFALLTECASKDKVYVRQVLDAIRSSGAPTEARGLAAGVLQGASPRDGDGAQWNLLQYILHL